MAYRMITRRAVKLCILRRTIHRTVTNKAKRSGGEGERSGAQDESGDGWGDTGTTEPWMQRELDLYFKGRKRLAEMMDVPQPDSFTDKDMADALRYLLPTRLTARDARPSLKHPMKVHPERKEAAFDGDGRPLDPGFYTGAPAYHNVLYNVYLHSKAVESVGIRKPSLPPPPPVNWLKREVMSNLIAEDLSPLQYEEIIKRLTTLSTHSKMNSETQKMLQIYQSKSSTQSQIDSLRRSLQTDGSSVQTVGRRKTSTAVVRVSRGSGVVTVNKRPFLEYFYRAEDRQQVLYPLLLTNSLQEYNINVSVHGGGLTGQSGAIRLAVSKALVALGKEGLGETGLLNRDPRSVERKKPGQKKARKKFTWVKR